MKLSFTFNQLEAFALSESRYFEIYGVMRSYCGIRTGEFWDHVDLMSALDTQLSQDYEDELGRYWSVRGEKFYCSLVTHAIQVRSVKEIVKLALGKQHTDPSSDVDRSLNRAVKDLKNLLRSVEW